MISKAKTPDEYIASLPEDRKEVMAELRKIFRKNLPKGFTEVMSYGMIGYVVPHTIYPAGYHCNPKLPLPFIGIASQKNFIAVYHMGMYGDKTLFNWFTSEYSKQFKTKSDIGKSCMRYKKQEQIPFKLIGDLATKITPKEWITFYEKNYKREK